ncbi:cell wall hydrolase [Tissierella pigra]|uniref:Cell wall hydrolase n=1 Tax=Tissierella pigra TaxID=2607614 RepID=A0A6N7XI98_9FIRM|nr:cell wall hydrolase [Tissierella pigra]MSU00472.1 cell wall hydrolase [Tissierella pigra]
MKKRVLSILSALVLVLSPITEVFASESYVKLEFTSKGNEVSKLQQELKKLGYYNISIDGIFGIVTENAVINFQKDNKLIIDGIAGKQTQNALYNKSTTVSRGTSTLRSSSRNYSDEDLLWLARIIEAEASGESYEGKVAVGNVILNRVDSKEFPNTIYGVIFEYYKNIPQFSPVAEGTIYNKPSEESIKAAKDALNGVRPVGNSTYFFNPSKAAGTWIVKNKTYVTKIGGHSFYN